MGLVLAILLVLAEKKILNYGTCKISINDGNKELEVQGGASLLSLLAEKNIYIPSACGGRGSCAYCKLVVSEGGGQLSPVEEPYLTADEIKAGVRLSCQVKVRNDISIQIPEALFKIKKYRARVEHKKVLTHDILELRFKLLDPQTIDFKAGQYVQLTSETYKGRESVMRAYSISSVPSEKNYIELNVRLVPDGICTTWVFDHMKEGQEVTLSGPYGDFMLSDTSAPMICMAGGSGMAPIHSIVNHMAEMNIQRLCYYFFGAQQQRDLFYLEELRKLERDHEWFTFIPALSAEPESSGWTGFRGLVTEALAEHFDDLTGYEAYLCGSPGMVGACEKELKKFNVEEDKIYYDEFA
ncbi:MAG: 2Fe-2S iron-sulfur cluster binding domain-containing protein [Candidatus Marinimicrobia bacterium]|nr:2Fe-2S iron-sulfur cluster binding domain-containing protein [Candidatus Neomarinimicrobiota bacterium]